MIRRLFQSLIVLVAVSIASYGLMGLMPGDPIDLMISADPDIKPEDVTRLKALHGLDQPLYARYAAWAGQALQGDFGYSRLFAAPVTEVLAPALGRSLILLGLALLVTVCVAIPLGVLAAMRPRSAVDYAVNMMAFGGVSVPVFWLGLMLISLFAVTLGWLPPGGVESVDGGGIVDRIEHLILPVLTLSVGAIAQHSRYVRSAMLEVLREPYMLTARAKGLSPLQAAINHGLRNAMVPVVTILGLDLGALFSGALITETVFAYPGVGKALYDAIMGSDYNLAMAGLLLATVVTLLGNALADLAQRRIDPRV